jgi:hypothetical protein
MKCVTLWVTPVVEPGRQLIHRPDRLVAHGRQLLLALAASDRADAAFKPLHEPLVAAP